MSLERRLEGGASSMREGRRQATWVVFGAVGGAITLAFAGGVAAWFDFSYQLGGPEKGVVWLLGATVVGAALGGALGAATRGMALWARTMLGAICGAAGGAVVVGAAFLFAEVTSGDWPHGLAAFMTGVALGGSMGLILGALASFSGSSVEPRAKS